MGDTTEELFAQFHDAVVHQDTEVAGKILSDHLGAFVLRDLDATRSAIARLDIRLAHTYPVVTVLHPRRHELARLAPRDSTLPRFPGHHGSPILRSVHVMAFDREAGRVRRAQQYAEQIITPMLSRAAPLKSSSTNAGDEWIVWYQFGKTRLAAGDLEKARSDFTTALGWVPTVEPLVRLTLGYLALVAALMGDTALARHHLDRAQTGSARVGSYLWGLYATARAIVEVEENTPACDDAIMALERIEDPAPLWPYLLLARTRYSDLTLRPADSLALIESARLLNSPETGSFAYDVLVARHIEVLILLARLNSARTIYEDRAIDAPHCRVALMALLCGELDFAALDRELEPVLRTSNLTHAQRVQAESFRALGVYLRDGAIPAYTACGLGRALSLPAHRRVALMFPPLLCSALEPYLSADLRADWQSAALKTRLWDREHVRRLKTLTERQLAMVRHLDRGHSYAEISEIEHVSLNTVKTHMKLLYKKLGATTSSDALAIARQWGLLDAQA